MSAIQSYCHHFQYGTHNRTNHLFKAGFSKEQVKEIMGWSSIEMVERYSGDYDGEGRRQANKVQFAADIEIEVSNENMKKSKLLSN